MDPLGHPVVIPQVNLFLPGTQSFLCYGALRDEAQAGVEAEWSFQKPRGQVENSPRNMRVGKSEAGKN